MKSEKFKKKILLDLRLLVIAIPSFIAGFLSSPFVENKIFDIDPILSGMSGAPALLIIPYLIISWMFHDRLYKS